MNIPQMGQYFLGENPSDGQGWRKRVVCAINQYNKQAYVNEHSDGANQQNQNLMKRSPKNSIMRFCAFRIKVIDTN